MIRHQNLTFTRPIPESELIKKIESGEVLGSDEIAPSTGYWFSIQEVEEVKRYFGDHIRLQSMMPMGADTTSSTNTALIHDKGKPEKTSKKAAPTLAPPPSERHAKPIPVQIEDGPPLRSRIIFGCFLILIFCGTLLALWSGSQ